MADDSVKARIAELKTKLPHLDPGTILLAAREFSVLPQLLWEGEEVLHAVQGMYNSHNGMLFATNRRLLFVDKGIVRLRTEDFGYENITSIECQTGLFFGKITLYASGNRAQISQCQKAPARSFCDFVRARLGEKGKGAAVAASPARGANVGDLEKLAALHKDGLLTDDEFRAAKARLLS